jgi:hypothetical protein
MSYQKDKAFCDALFADTIRETHRNKLAEEFKQPAVSTEETLVRGHRKYPQPTKTYYAGEGRRHGRCG